MLVLAIDVGNSTTTVGLFAMDGTLRFRWALSTRKGMTRDQYAIDLAQAFQLYNADVKSISGSIISSVVPPVTAAICDAVAFLSGKPPLLMGPGVKTGLNIRSDIHGQMGTDIVATAVAAIAKYPGPIIVVELGTAIALSLLVGSTYEGCVLLPGVRVALEALSDHAAELPHISIEPPPFVLGRNTVDAMRSGAVYGNACLIDGMIDRIEETGTKAVTIVATGTDGAEVLHHCKHNIIYDADLLLHGLYLVYQKSTEQKPRKV